MLAISKTNRKPVFFISSRGLGQVYELHKKQKKILHKKINQSERNMRFQK